MRQMFRCGGVMLALVVLVSAWAAAQNPVVPGTPALPKAGEINGKLVMAGGSSRTLVVAMDVQSYEANKTTARNTGNSNVQNILRQQMQLQQAQARVMQARSPRERMQRMQQVQQQMARLQMEMARMGMQPQQSPFKLVTKREDYEIQTDDNTRIRFYQPPVAFDEKGNPKKYTEAELKQLRGSDPRLPGYEGQFDQLRPGHVLKVVLGQPGGNKTGKDLDKEPLVSDKPYATMVLVTGEGPPPAPQRKK